MSLAPAAGQRWLVRGLLPYRRRVATIDAVCDDEVVFRFVDSGGPSRCSLNVFQRVFVLEAAA